MVWTTWEDKGARNPFGQALAWIACSCCRVYQYTAVVYSVTSIRRLRIVACFIHSADGYAWSGQDLIWWHIHDDHIITITLLEYMFEASMASSHHLTGPCSQERKIPVAEDQVQVSASHRHASRSCARRSAHPELRQRQMQLWMSRPPHRTAPHGAARGLEGVSHAREGLPELRNGTGGDAAK